MKHRFLPLPPAKPFLRFSNLGWKNYTILASASVRIHQFPIFLVLSFSPHPVYASFNFQEHILQMDTLAKHAKVTKQTHIQVNFPFDIRTSGYVGLLGVLIIQRSTESTGIQTFAQKVRSPFVFIQLFWFVHVNWKCVICWIYQYIKSKWTSENMYQTYSYLNKI